MIHYSVHRQQGKRNQLNSHHVEEAVVFSKGLYLQESSYISTTNRGEGEVTSTNQTYFSTVTGELTTLSE